MHKLLLFQQVGLKKTNSSLRSEIEALLWMEQHRPTTLRRLMCAVSVSTVCVCRRKPLDDLKMSIYLALTFPSGTKWYLNTKGLHIPRKDRDREPADFILHVEFLTNHTIAPGHHRRKQFCFAHLIRTSCMESQTRAPIKISRHLTALAENICLFLRSVYRPLKTGSTSFMVLTHCRFKPQSHWAIEHVACAREI